MRKILLVATMALAGGSVHAQGLTNLQLAQAPASEAAAPAQAAPAPQAAPPAQAAPAPQAGPVPQAVAPAPQAAAPAAVAPPAAQPAKPAKKRVARRHETDEQKARRIAAKYGVSW